MTERVVMPPAMRLALRLALNHIEPGFENTKAVLQAYMDEAASPISPPAQKGVPIDAVAQQEEK